MLSRRGLCYDTRQGLLGVALLCVGAVLPALLDTSVFRIYEQLYLAAELRDSGFLFWSALRLVAMNCVRTTPCYFGAVTAAEAFSRQKPGRSLPMLLVRLGISSLAMIVCYALISAFYRTSYDFGAPALCTLLICCTLKEFDLFPAEYGYKLIVIALLIITAQWLTVIPALTPLRFGRGEVATDIKGFALLLGRTRELGAFAVLMSLVFFLAVAIIVKLANDEKELEKGEQQKALANARIVEMQLSSLSLRSFREIQHLVHDLKTPLTTIQGLSSLTELLLKEPQLAAYQRRITAAVDNMNEMISEILNEDSRSLITLRELFSLVLSQLSTNEALAHMLHVENACPEAHIHANKIRLARAVINLVENAQYAVDDAHRNDPEAARVLLRAERDEGYVRICVRDNGTGISAEALGNIWLPGYSMTASSGLGLSFVKSVVEGHGGSIGFTSKEGAYTNAVIRLREVTEDGAEDKDSHH